MVELTKEQLDDLAYAVHKVIKVLGDKVERVEATTPKGTVKVTGYWVGNMIRVDIKL